MYVGLEVVTNNLLEISLPSTPDGSLHHHRQVLLDAPSEERRRGRGEDAVGDAVCEHLGNVMHSDVIRVVKEVIVINVTEVVNVLNVVSETNVVFSVPNVRMCYQLTLKCWRGAEEDLLTGVVGVRRHHGQAGLCGPRHGPASPLR